MNHTIDQTMRAIIDLLRRVELHHPTALEKSLPDYNPVTIRRAFGELKKLGLAEGTFTFGGVVDPQLTTRTLRAIESGKDPLTEPAAPTIHRIVQHISNSTIAGNVAAGSNIIQHSAAVARGAETFQELREAIETKIDDSAKRQQLSDAVTQMESTVGRAEFVAAYQHFMSFASDHLQVFGTLLPALAMLL